ncbi:MAG: hypothetical protein LBK28_08775 [Propionibacteriaceae bacterium]|nr:hypothetical protein [Propionibacteriaceae bacterium]
MIWVLAFLGIALGGIVMLICYAVWLAHKASDLFSELEMLGTRAEEFGNIVGKLALTSENE